MIGRRHAIACLAGRPSHSACRTRPGAILSGQAGAHGDRVSGRRLDRHARAHPGAKTVRAWGQSVVVENRPGAGGNLGAAAAAQAAPDGYTLHLGAQTLAVNPTIAPYQGFDPIRISNRSYWWRPRRTC